MQLPAASVAPYCPEGQLTQTAPPSDVNVPRRQAVQTADAVAPVAGCDVPAGQLAQAEDPAEVSYLPAAQLEHFKK